MILPVLYKYSNPKRDKTVTEQVQFITISVHYLSRIV